MEAERRTVIERERENEKGESVGRAEENIVR